jgi:HK97 family phage major capsid protein|tara:strand:- start:3376 stop:4614 length:1239 start_codon:yes stop_codon:yes gene_type:complete
MSNIDDNTQEHLNKLADLIDEKIEKAGKASKDNLEGKVDEVIKGEVENLVSKFNEETEALNKRIDTFEVENKKNNFNNTFVSKKEAFNDAIGKSESLKAMKEGSRGNASIEMKADVLISSDFAGASSSRDATGVLRVDGIKRDPSNVTNMMGIIPVGNTDSNVIRYVKESAYTDNAANVAEGSAPTDSEFQLTAEDAVVQKTSAVMTISQEMLDDTPGLSSYLSQRLPAKINTVIDDQLIGGSGSSPNLLGLMNGGTTFAAGGFANAIESAQELDVLYVAMNQLALSNYAANGIVLNPTDFHKIALLKDTTNEYLRGNSLVSADGFFRINGVPVYMNNKMAAGNFVVADFSQASQVWQREGLRVDFGYEDSDNFSKYLVSVRGIARIAHSIYLPTGIVKGAFSTAKTALETS